MRNAHLKTVRRLWKECVYCPYMSTYLICMRSSARLFFGRGALMAKALGITPEEEHRPGLAPLARVSGHFLTYSFEAHSKHRPANKRAGRTAIHRHGTTRGDRVVQGLSPT